MSDKNEIPQASPPRLHPRPHYHWHSSDLSPPSTTSHMDRLIEWNEDWTPEWGGQKAWTLHFVPPSRLTMQNPEPNFGLKPLIPRRKLWRVEADGSVAAIPIFWGGVGFNVGNMDTKDG